LSNITTSYRFHKELELPVAFVRREWKALAVFGGGFVLVFLAAVLAIDPAFFYPRLSTDPLLYYLKGLAFAETGHTTARTAINRAPFEYVAMPGVLRSPFMFAFRDFDTQLRAIQLSNIVLVGLTATMYSYILSWTVPRKWHWLAIGFAFGFMLLSPDWGANVFTTLADAPYAAFSIAFVILAARVLGSDRPIRSRTWAIGAGAVLFTVAFLIRFTAPLLLVYAGVVSAGRSRHHQLSRRVKVAGAVAAVAGVAILLALNWETMRSRYLIEPYLYLLHAGKAGMLMNLFASALPSQIVGDFHLAFAIQPIMDPYHVRFGTSAGDVALIVVGFAISATTFLGMWHSRRRFAPEIAYTLAALPVLTLMIPSTARYLLAYQPFFWIFFYAGASVLVGPIALRIAAGPRALFVGLSLLVLTATGLVYLRSRRIAGTVGDRGAAISIGESRAYVNDVASTFGELRRFLVTLPRERTLLIGASGTVGRWKVIAGLDYYRPDSALSVATTTRDTYLVVECGTLDYCQDFNNWDEQFRKDFGKFGQFSFEPVFARITQHAKARVYRVRNRQ